MDNTLKRTTARNVGYNSIATLLTYLLQFLTTLTLARILLPADYGIVGFCQIFINFMMQFGDFGINTALIQRDRISDEIIGTAFTLKVGLCLGLCALLFVMAPLSHYFIDRPEATRVIRVLSLNFLISIPAFLPQMLMTRNLEYKRLMIPQTVAMAATSLVAITLAWRGFGYWSLVCGSLTTSVVTALLLTMLRPVRPRMTFHRDEARRLLHFGGSLLVPGAITFLIFNTDNFIIGSLRGAESLGYYSIAFNWGSMVCIVLAGLFHKVLFPTFSRIQGDLTALKKAYLTSLRYIGFLAVPINLLLFLEAHEFLQFVLAKGSDRWLPALTAFRILCGYGIIRALLEPVGNVIVALGKPQLCVKAIILVAVVEMGLLYPAVTWGGIEAVAVAVTLAYLSQYCVYLPLIRRELAIRAGELFNELRTTFIAALVMSAAVLAVRAVTGFSFTALVIQVAVGVLVYGAGFGLIDRGKMYGELKALAVGR